MLSAAGFWEFDDCFPGLYMLAAVQDTIVHLQALQNPGIAHEWPSTVAGCWEEGGCSSSLYLLAKLWPEGRDFSPFVSSLPNDLPQELICNVSLHVDLAWRCSNLCAVLALILVAKLPCPVQSNAGGPPLCVAVERGNVPLVRSVSQHVRSCWAALFQD